MELGQACSIKLYIACSTVPVQSDSATFECPIPFMLIRNLFYTQSDPVSILFQPCSNPVSTLLHPHSADQVHMDAASGRCGPRSPRLHSLAISRLSRRRRCGRDWLVARP